MPVEEPDLVPLATRVSEQLRRAVKARAAMEGRSVQSLVTEALPTESRARPLAPTARTPRASAAGCHAAWYWSGVLGELYGEAIETRFANDLQQVTDLPKLLAEGETTTQELRARLDQHHVDYDLLAADDFDGFFEVRRKRLLDLIAAAMGKTIVEPATPSLPEDYDLEDEEPSDADINESVA